MEYQLLCRECLSKINIDVSPHVDNKFECKKCKSIYKYTSGILDLAPLNMDTKLDVHSYIDNHNETHSEWIYKNIFFPFLENLQGRRFEKALEIASGPGNLTRYIQKNSIFKSLVVSDISPGFLEHQILNIKHTISECESLWVRFDANSIPFVDSSFDVVYGNSVLHHFLNYNKTILECSRVLKKNGVAIFGEPFYSGYEPFFLIIELICELEKFTFPTFSSEEIKILSQAPKNIKMIYNLRKENFSELEKFEDKFFFDHEEIMSLSIKSGFNKCIFLNDVTEYSPLHHPTIDHYKNMVMQYIPNSSSRKKLDKYHWVFELVYRNLIEPRLGKLEVATYTSFCLIK